MSANENIKIYMLKSLFSDLVIQQGLVSALCDKSHLFMLIPQASRSSLEANQQRLFKNVLLFKGALDNFSLIY